MTHYVNLNFGNCCLRPELRDDCDRILQLWNKPYVIGNLYMSKTSRETFCGFYNKYVTDSTAMNWVITQNGGEFVGTIGISSITECDCKIGRFAMEKKVDVPVALPQTLVKSFVFDVLKLDRINFTLNSDNKRIKKFHKILGAVNTGNVEMKLGSHGGIVALEHWYYDRTAWDFAMDISLCGM